MTATVDGDAVEVNAAEAAGDPGGGSPPSAELVHQPVTHEVLRPLDVAEQTAAMQQYQQGLQSILDASDWQNAGRGESFVKKSGWRKIATWFNLSVTLVTDEVERDADGQVVRAKAVARATAPNGRTMDGDGYCDVSESRFNRNKGKLENDLRGTATTRAKNRAIADLVGMGAVSAEEVDAPAQQQGPPNGPPADDAATERFGQALAYLLMDDRGEPNAQAALEVGGAIHEDCGGYLPRQVARAVLRVAARLKQQLDTAAGGTPAATTDAPSESAEDVPDADVVSDDDQQPPPGVGEQLGDADLDPPNTTTTQQEA